MTRIPYDPIVPLDLSKQSPTPGRAGRYISRGRFSVPPRAPLNSFLAPGRGAGMRCIPDRSRIAGRIGRCVFASAVLTIFLSSTSLALSPALFLQPTGSGADDNFGCSVSLTGDVNGDGYPDVIIGADHNDAGGADAGRAYIYFGGPNADQVADRILTGAAAGDLFGHTVASAGDVNGDGYADVIVGAHQNSAGGSNAGRAYVFYGGPSADNVADLTFTGKAGGDFLGEAVSGAGDVNGDTYADLIVGARLNDAGGANAGRAYVYYGGPSADNGPDLTLTGAVGGDEFGTSVASAGDVNGDGKADVIVGAPLNDAGGADAGRAYVFYGGTSPDNVQDLTFTGLVAGDALGSSVSGAGDVNRDGKSDLIVGAYAHDVGPLQNVGHAYIFYGGPGADSVADKTMSGVSGFDDFGISVGSAGDVNGDGDADVIVGALIAEVTGSNIGKAYVFFGGP